MRFLTQPVYATGIHGITRRPYVEGYLPAGTLVRNVEHSDDGELVRFQASTDEGSTWYDQEAYCEALPTN